MACVVVPPGGWGDKCTPTTPCGENLSCNTAGYCQNTKSSWGNQPVYGRPCFGDTADCNLDDLGTTRLTCLSHSQGDLPATFMRCGCSDSMDKQTCGVDADNHARVCDKTKAVNMPDLPKV
jgi:hypothetical protein